MKSKEEAFKKFLGARPASIAVTADHLVRISSLQTKQRLPLLIEPAISNFDAITWLRNNLELIEKKLLETGGILFRNFEIDSIEDFDRFVRTISPQLIGYIDQHTPRTRAQGDIYTSTEYPAEHTVPFHSENSKNHKWPMKIWFCCLQPAETGGETLIADNRLVYKSLNPELREQFVRKNVMYVRNFGEGLGLSWHTAFQTTDRAAVERFCNEAGMGFEWKDNNRLKIRHVGQAVARHPITKEMLWFNQAHLFHLSTLNTEVRESLLNLFSEDDLPSNAYYGDGSSIEDSAIAEINRCFADASVCFAWQKGDILMLENMIVAHGRAPFTGTRKVYVALANSCERHSR